jgi:hypothetical protein
VAKALKTLDGVAKAIERHIVTGKDAETKELTGWGSLLNGECVGDVLPAKAIFSLVYGVGFCGSHSRAEESA